MKNRKNLIIWVAIGLVVIIGFIWYFSSRPQTTVSPTTSQAPIGPTRINAKGQKWGPLWTKSTTYQVVEADGTGPKFIQVTIDPPDVYVGNVQKLKAVVQSPSGIKSVIAEIETDNGTTTLPLTKTGVVTYSQLLPEKYVVENNLLKILSPAEVQMRYEEKVLADENYLINKAKAAEGEKEIWEGSWTVHDTHDKYYHTIFTATDNLGRVTSLTMAWSDLCDIPMTGPYTLIGPCEFAVGNEDGAANGNLNIGPYTVTLDGSLVQGAIQLGYMSGYSITIPSGGKIALANVAGTARIGQVSAMYVTDADADGHAPSSWVKYNRSGVSGTNNVNNITDATDCSDSNSAIYVTQSCYVDSDGDSYTNGTSNICTNSTCTSPSGYRSSSAGSDCYDSNANANPGQSGWFFTSRGDGSFDYNCSGVAEQQFTQASACQIMRNNPLKQFAIENITNKIITVAKAAYKLAQSGCTAYVNCLGWQGGGAAACGTTGSWNASDTGCVGATPQDQYCH